MEKLPMCRICLVENVSMYVVVNRNLHELYEKLTSIPFVTEDSRPMLACFFCCTKLKQCYRLQRKCLEAEELFAQIMNEDYEPKFLNQDHEFHSGFIKSPTENISIVDECQTESIAIKEELPAVCEGLDDITEPEEERQSDELEPENFEHSYLDVADIPPYHSESDLEDDVPLMKFKIEVDEEQEVFTKKRRVRETTSTNIHKSSSPLYARSCDENIEKDINYNNTSGNNSEENKFILRQRSPSISSSISSSSKSSSYTKCNSSDSKNRESEECNKECNNMISLNEKELYSLENKVSIELVNDNMKDETAVESDSQIESEPKAIELTNMNAESEEDRGEKDFSLDDSIADPNYHHINSDETVEQNEEDNISSRSNQNITRRKKGQPELWKSNVAKRLRNAGKEYVGKNNRVMRERRLGPGCTEKCKLKCNTKFDAETRRHIFDAYYKLPDLKSKRTFVAFNMSSIVPKYQYKKGTRRNNNAFYLKDKDNEKIRVCKKFFMSTLDVSDRFIRTVIEKSRSDVSGIMEDLRGKHGNQNRVDNIIKDRLRNFVKAIPKIESHYCRAGTRKDIDGSKTIAEIYRDYVKQCEEKRENSGAAVAKKSKLEDAITAEQKNNEKSDSKVIRTTQKRTSKPGTYFKEPYKCDQRSFNPGKNMIQHTRTQIGKIPCKCDACLRSFSEKGKLTNRVRIHADEKPYKCDICQRSFSAKSRLSRHIVKHTGEKPYKCDVCQRSFSAKSHLSRHFVIHTGEKPYKCDVCQRSFSAKCNLSRHIVIHTGEKSYMCDICQRSFSAKWILKNHVRVHADKKPKCDICQRSFSDKRYLLEHIRIHSDEKAYKCDVCQRSFSAIRHLSVHKRIHTGEKPYKCDVCQRSFSVKNSLSRHIVIHTGEKPYKCDVCQRSFNVKNSLSRHIVIHTGEKPYKCDVCQRSFVQKRSLTGHIRIHTGEKPYKCDLCQRSFSQKCFLTEHIQTHTGGKSFKCEICQRSFSQFCNLKRHVLNHTGKKT